MAALNPTRTLRRMFDGVADLDRAAPRLAVAKFLALMFARGPLIELIPGSNRPGGISWSGRLASGPRLPAFRAALAFARLRASVLVMSSSPF